MPSRIASDKYKDYTSKTKSCMILFFNTFSMVYVIKNMICNNRIKKSLICFFHNLYYKNRSDDL